MMKIPFYSLERQTVFENTVAILHQNNKGVSSQKPGDTLWCAGPWFKSQDDPSRGCKQASWAKYWWVLIINFEKQKQKNNNNDDESSSQQKAENMYSLQCCTTCKTFWSKQNVFRPWLFSFINSTQSKTLHVIRMKFLFASCMTYRYIKDPLKILPYNISKFENVHNFCFLYVVLDTVFLKMDYQERFLHICR